MLPLDPFRTMKDELVGLSDGCAGLLRSRLLGLPGFGARVVAEACPLPGTTELPQSNAPAHNLSKVAHNYRPLAADPVRFNALFCHMDVPNCRAGAAGDLATPR